MKYKIELPQVPRGPPNYIFEKYGMSAFTGKKIIPLAIFVQFLRSIEIHQISAGKFECLSRKFIDSNLEFLSGNLMNFTRM